MYADTIGPQSRSQGFEGGGGGRAYTISRGSMGVKQNYLRKGVRSIVQPPPTPRTIRENL